MDSRNDKANNQYGLRNRKHINRKGGLSIHKQGSGNKEEDKEEEEEVFRPHQRRRVDQADDNNHGEVMDVPRAIDFSAFALNPEGTEGVHKENNGQRETLPNNEGQGGGGGGKTVNNQGQGGGGRGGGGRGGGGRGGGGRGGGGREGYAQGNAAAANNQGH